MKKIAAGILTAALVVSIGTAGAFAAGPAFHKGQGFVDGNGDGVCDNYSSVCSGQGFVDADGDGVCDNYSTACSGQGFVDADGDGVCDNYSSVCSGQGFVDADGDGVCDNQGTSAFCRKGAGKGRNW